MKTDYDVDGDQVLSQSLFPLSMKVTTKQKKFGTAAQRLESVSHATNQPTIEITFHRQKNYSMNSDFSVFSSQIHFTHPLFRWFVHCNFHTFPGLMF